ncbi:MAG: 6-carboxytetrahydropterin synthase [Peptococcaceae bacterium]|nr:6-carboxytetrahydropterin synthase [Peptococcaceae bacterium]
MRLKELKDREVKELALKVEIKKNDLENAELALEESIRIAGDTENNARLEARRLLAEAEAVAAARNAQARNIEKEMADLIGELNYYNQLLNTGNAGKEKKVQPSPPGDSNIHDVHVKVKDLKLSYSSIYTIKLVSFINARHFVSFGNKPGPIHAHSWQIQIEVRVPAESTELVAFAKIFEAVKSVLEPFEDVILNYVHPFNKIQPTTENIALYLFNRLEDALQPMGLSLGKIVAWETPTRGIMVESRYPGIDALIEKGGHGEEVFPPVKEVAAAEDSQKDQYEFDGEPVSGRGEAPARTLPEKEAGAAGPRGYSFSRYAVSFAVIAVIAFISYYSVMFPPAERHYPWGSDAWGHLFKAEYLYNEILKGNYYPQFTEYWYNGSQPFRYWPPLPYYVLALLRAFTGDIFIAGNYFVVLCAFFGGLSWLFLAGRMGLWPATLAGAVWVVWQDNVRVAFAEGNLPRVLATALLPLIFVSFLNILEKRKSIAAVFFSVALIHLAVVCHAMVAAAYFICMWWFAFFLWCFRGCGFKDVVRGVLVLAGGIATASWWLLPGLTGGIAQSDPEAVKAFIQFVPAAVSFDPLYRFANRETFYWGAGILIALAATFLKFRSKPPWAKSLAVCGIFLILITFPAMRLFYATLPLSHLIWPLRFTSFAALAVLAPALTFNPPDMRRGLLKSRYAACLLIAGIFGVLFTDSIVSLRLLAHTGEKSFKLIQASEALKSKPGWRVATIDLSRLGSAPSFLLSYMAGLEQVFGWAWQGAVTSANIILINTGLETQYYPFLFRSCIYLGATDLLVKDDVVENPEAFGNAAAGAGYRRLYEAGGISIWHGFDQPYLVEKSYRGLAVGKFAGILALQFPELEMAASRYIDDYPLEYYKKYPVVIFTGAEYRSKTKAEEIAAGYAASGGRVIVDLAGMPQSVLSRRPEFLGVGGEAVMLRGPLSVYGRGRNIPLQPFSDKIPVWNAYVPLLLDEVELEFTYYGNQAPVFGYKKVAGAKVGFLGGNIVYHAFLTGDRAALNLMADILGLRTDYTAGRIIPLTHYRANERGYVMGCRAERDIEVIVPVAAMDGIKVELDGAPVSVGRFENLLLLNLPAGSHEIVITLEKTPVYLWGMIISAVSAALILAAVLIPPRRTDGGQS